MTLKTQCEPVLLMGRHISPAAYTDRHYTCAHVHAPTHVRSNMTTHEEQCPGNPSPAKANCQTNVHPFSSPQILHTPPPRAGETATAVPMNDERASQPAPVRVGPVDVEGPSKNCICGLPADGGAIADGAGQPASRISSRRMSDSQRRPSVW